MVTKDWWVEGVENYCLMCMEFQFCKVKKVLEVYGGNVNVLKNG